MTERSTSGRAAAEHVLTVRARRVSEGLGDGSSERVAESVRLQGRLAATITLMHALGGYIFRPPADLPTAVAPPISNL